MSTIDHVGVIRPSLAGQIVRVACRRHDVDLRLSQHMRDPGPIERVFGPEDDAEA